MKDARLASILSMLRQSCWGEPPPRRFLAGGVACALAGATATLQAPSGAASMRALAGGRRSRHPRPGPPLVREDGAPLLVGGRGTAAHRGTLRRSLTGVMACAGGRRSHLHGLLPFSDVRYREECKRDGEHRRW